MSQFLVSFLLNISFLVYACVKLTHLSLFLLLRNTLAEIYIIDKFYLSVKFT